MAKDESYTAILDEEDYDEIQENAAELPLTDKPAPSRSVDGYYTGQKTVGIAAAVSAAIFIIEIVLSVFIGKAYICIGEDPGQDMSA